MLDKLYYLEFSENEDGDIKFTCYDLKVFHIDAKETLYALKEGGMVVVDKYVYGEGDHMYACNYKDFEKLNITASDVESIYNRAKSQKQSPLIEKVETYINYLDMLINMIDKYEEAHEGVRPKKYYEQLIRDRKAKLKELDELNKTMSELSFVEDTVWMAYLSLQDV